MEERAEASDGRNSIHQIMLFGDFCFEDLEKKQHGGNEGKHQINQIEAVLCRSPRTMEAGGTSSLVELGGPGLGGRSRMMFGRFRKLF